MARERAPGGRDGQAAATRARRHRQAGSLLCAGALLLGAGPASSQEQEDEPPPLAPAFSQLDKNSDARLSRAELPVALLPRFEEIDSDGDGGIDRFEAWDWDDRVIEDRDSPLPAGAALEEPAQKAPSLSAVMSGQTGRRQVTVTEFVAQRDADGDGRLSPAEVPAQYRDRFDRLDLDADGFIDAEDARILDERVKAASEQKASDRRRTLSGIVRYMDTNADGLLQKREAPLRLQQEFDRFDTNGDGAIDAEEAAEFDRRLEQQR